MAGGGLVRPHGDPHGLIHEDTLKLTGPVQTFESDFNGIRTAKITTCPRLDDGLLSTAQDESILFRLR